MSQEYNFQRFLELFACHWLIHLVVWYWFFPLKSKPFEWYFVGPKIFRYRVRYSFNLNGLIRNAEFVWIIIFHLKVFWARGEKVFSHTEFMGAEGFWEIGNWTENIDMFWWIPFCWAFIGLGSFASHWNILVCCLNSRILSNSV